jgi:hypothetical protein
VLAFSVAWLEQFPAKPGRLTAALLRWPLGHVLNSMENKEINARETGEWRQGDLSQNGLN